MNTRMCVVCRKKLEKNQLCRIAQSDNSLMVDTKKQQKGKGSYVCFNDDCIETLINKKTLNRVFKQNFSQDAYCKLKGEIDIANNKN